MSNIKIEKDELSEILSEIAITTLGKYYLKDTKQDTEFINRFQEAYRQGCGIWDGLRDSVKGLIVKANPVQFKQSDHKTTNTKPSVNKSIMFEANPSNQETSTLKKIENANPVDLRQISLQTDKNINKHLESEMIKFFEEKGGCLYENSLVEYLLAEIGLKKGEFESDMTKFLQNSCMKIGNTYFIKSINDGSLDPVFVI